MDAEEVRALRLAVLRPGGTRDDVVWPGDDDPRAAHFAARETLDHPPKSAGHLSEGGRVLGVATIVPEGHPVDPRGGDWRVRGMATDPAARGRGIGAALLDACVEHARSAGAARVWCNARIGAVSLYERAGFAVETDVFEEPGIGPHRRMALAVG